MRHGRAWATISPKSCCWTRAPRQPKPGPSSAGIRPIPGWPTSSATGATESTEADRPAPAGGCGELGRVTRSLRTKPRSAHGRTDRVVSGRPRAADMADSSGSSQPGSGLDDRSGYLPISEHGLIGDLHTVALVGTNGTIDWHCSPSFDAPSIFGSILDADGGGCFELAADVPAKTRQFYLPDTNVLITRFSAENGVGEVQDFMPVGGAAHARRHRVIRRVVCVRGIMPFRTRVAPRFGYGTAPHTLTEAEVGVVFTSGSLTVGLSATVPVEHDGRDVTAQFKLTEGDSEVLALDEVTGGAVPRGCSREEARELGEATIAFWRNWLSASRYRGRWREGVHRSALTLKLLP